MHASSSETQLPPVGLPWFARRDSSGATDWLAHVERVLKGAVELVRLLAGEGCSVLVHCSDGWDRTPRGGPP